MVRPSLNKEAGVNSAKGKILDCEYSNRTFSDTQHVIDHGASFVDLSQVEGRYYQSILHKINSDYGFNDAA